MQATTPALVLVLFFAVGCTGRRVQFQPDSQARPLAPAGFAELGSAHVGPLVDEPETSNAPEPFRGAASKAPATIPVELARTKSSEIVDAPPARESETAGQSTPNAKVHSDGKSLSSYVRSMSSQLKEAMTSKQPSSEVAGDVPVSGIAMHVESFQMLFNEARKDPLSLKILPILISIGLAVVIVLCMCCPCCGKRAGSSRTARDGGRRRNNRFAQNSSSPQRPSADGAGASSGSFRDVGRGAPSSEERSSRASADGVRTDGSKLNRNNPEDSLDLDSSMSSSLGSAVRSEEKVEAEAALLEQIEELAGQTSRTVQKYPKSGRSLFSKNRHVAAMPAAERLGVSSSKASDPRRIIQRWRNGKFGWWESEEAWTQGLDPKGTMDLMAIVKVQTYKDDKSGRGVVIKYNAPNEKNEMEPCEMVLMFPTKRDADEWGYSLWSFLSKLRTRATDGAFLSRSSMAPTGGSGGSGRVERQATSNEDNRLSPWS